MRDKISIKDLFSNGFQEGSVDSVLGFLEFNDLVVYAIKKHCEQQNFSELQTMKALVAVLGLWKKSAIERDLLRFTEAQTNLHRTILSRTEQIASGL
jgi:hypothetical protein